MNGSDLGESRLVAGKGTDASTGQPKGLPEPYSHYGGYQWVVFATMALAYYMTYFFRVSSGVMVPDLMRDFNVDARRVGFLISIYFLAGAIGNTLVGPLCDSFGTRVTSSVFLLLASVGAVCFSLSPSYPSAVLSRVLMGFGTAGIYIPTLKVLSEWFKSTVFATLTGILIAIGNLGGILGTSILSILVLRIGWRSSLGLAGVITLLISVMCWVLVRDRPAHVDAGQGAKKKIDRGLALLRPLVQGILIKEILLISAVGLVRWGATMAFQTTWGGFYLTEVRGLTKMQAGNILALVSFGYMAGAPLAGYLSDRVFHSRKGVLVMTQAWYAAAWVPLALWTRNLAPLVLCFCALAMGIGGGAGVAIGFTMAKEAVSASVVGAATAAMNILQMLGAALYQPIIGWMIDLHSRGSVTPSSTSFTAAFWFCLVTIVLSSLCLVPVRETMPLAENGQRTLKNV